MKGKLLNNAQCCYNHEGGHGAHREIPPLAEFGCAPIQDTDGTPHDLTRNGATTLRLGSRVRKFEPSRPDRRNPPEFRRVSFFPCEGTRRLFPFVANTVWRLTEQGQTEALRAAARAGVVEAPGGGDGAHVLVVHSDPMLLGFIANFMHFTTDYRVSVTTQARASWSERLPDVDVALVEGSTRLVAALERAGMRCVRLVATPTNHPAELAMPFTSEALLQTLRGRLASEPIGAAWEAGEASQAARPGHVTRRGV